MTPNLKRRMAGATTLLAAIAAIGFAQPTQAQAVGCATPNVQMTQAYNYNCTWGQHYVVAGGVYHYAPKVGPQTWSKDPVCYAGTTSWGARTSGVGTSAS